MGINIVKFVKDMGMIVVLKFMETIYGLIVVGKMNDVLILFEDYINKYLFVEEEEEKENGRLWGC